MNKSFWIAALKRAGHAFAQTALALIPAAARIEAVDWMTVLSTSALAFVVSILKSLTIGMPEAQIEERKPPDEDGDSNDGDDFDDYSYESVDEANCPIRVFAYNNYDENGDPVPDSDGGGEDA